MNTYGTGKTVHWEKYSPCRYPMTIARSCLSPSPCCHEKFIASQKIINSCVRSKSNWQMRECMLASGGAWENKKVSAVTYDHVIRNSWWCLGTTVAVLISWQLGKLEGDVGILLIGVTKRGMIDEANIFPFQLHRFETTRLLLSFLSFLSNALVRFVFVH